MKLKNVVKALGWTFIFVFVIMITYAFLQVLGKLLLAVLVGLTVMAALSCLFRAIISYTNSKKK